MVARPGPCSLLLVVLACPGLLRAQQESRAPAVLVEDGDEPLVRLVLVGSVVGADGRSAPGVTVTSSAGGEALTDEDGAYRLVVRMPVTADAVGLDFAGGDGSSARARATWSASRLLQVGTTRLTRGGCAPGWIPTFAGESRLNDAVHDLQVFDEGAGPMLFAGGSFTQTSAAVMPGIARWDGHVWTSVGGLLNFGSIVRALAVFDDGSGPALYAAGRITTAGGMPVANLARWDGAAWTSIGGTDGDVHALAVFDGGAGPELYIGGVFDHAGGVAASRIARWNGSRWSAVGYQVPGSPRIPDLLGEPAGTNGPVYALEALDLGHGPALFVGGAFTHAGGLEANGVARWNGSSWKKLGSGVDHSPFPPIVRCLEGFDDGSGARLIVGGAFDRAGGVPAVDVASWDGTSWSALPGLGGEPRELLGVTGGSGSGLYAAGLFLNTMVSRWDGNQWIPESLPSTGPIPFPGILGVEALATWDGGSGPELHAGGSFGLDAFGCMAVRRGTTWSPLQDQIDDSVASLATFDDGTGEALYAAGAFEHVGAEEVAHVARWDGSGWVGLGQGTNGSAHDLAVFDGGAGPELYVCGNFTQAGGIEANGIARWNGSTWSAIGTTSSRSYEDLEVFDDGGGPALYVAGAFTSVVDGLSTRNVARWDGASWSAVGSGLPSTVRSLCVFDDGTGPALYAGGRMRSGQGYVQVVRWAGVQWEKVLVLPLAAMVNALGVFDDGSGAALYLGGDRFNPGGWSRIGRWDGTSYSDLGTGASNGVTSFTVFDDGSGPALYAGGAFALMDGLLVNGLARWDGSSWSALGPGVGNVTALEVFDDGVGPALFVGGSFRRARGSGDAAMARWGCGP